MLRGSIESKITGTSMQYWYQSPAEAVLEKLNVKQGEGLSDQEATKRLKEYGPNQLESAKPLNPLKLFLGQFNDALVIVLLIAATVSFGLAFIEDGGSVKESLLIFAIVIAIALVGFFNEFKAEKTIEALKKLVGFKARVRRDGKASEIDSAELVPGDIVFIEAGQKVPADIRLLEVTSLSVNESSLTGESLPVSKKIDVIEETSPLGDQKCMLFGGTFVTNGSGLGVVVGTGEKTELGKIADLVKGVEKEDTPMQQKLDDLGKKLGYLIAGICAIVFVVVFFLVPEATHATFLHRLIFAFTAAVALAVAAIPEGLAFVVRISLAFGARRMADKKALVRKLSAVEALGSTDVICSDKTGTLTKGEMTVRSLYIDGHIGSIEGSGYQTEGTISFDGVAPSALQKLLTTGALCNNAELRDGTVMGDPTEGCLYVSAAKADLDYIALNKKYPRVGEIPFTSERKLMTTAHKNGDAYEVHTKGAVENMMSICSHYLNAAGESKPLTPNVKKQILEANKQFASEALRVLGFAYKQTSNKLEEDDMEKDLIFIGIQAMMDPPRLEVKEVIQRVQTDSGMRVVMITGDYIETAKAIATEVGIVGDAISGPELDDLSQSEFEKRVEQISIYARVNPEHKIRIVKALKKHGHQVAMTGDGVNDAPAIKAADIGIAMGITGTDVSKEAADLILLDDQFLTIINAIEEGRGIFDNVRKFVNFLISCNIAEVITILLGILVFNNLLLTAAQLLFINIVTDGLPAVALGSDPAQKNVLQAKPKLYQGSIITKRLWVEIAFFGVLMSILLIGQYWYNITYFNSLAAVSAAFTAMVVYEMMRLVDIRSDYAIRWLSNPWLTVAIVSSIALQFAVLYIPALAKIFKVQPLMAHDWWIIAGGSVALIIIMKISNPILDRFFSKEHPELATK